jgi:hypothetical protein
MKCTSFNYVLYAASTIHTFLDFNLRPDLTCYFLELVSNNGVKEIDILIA